MNPVAQYQINQTKQKVRKMMIGNPKLRKKYIERRRIDKKLNDLEVEHMKKYLLKL